MNPIKQNSKMTKIITPFPLKFIIVLHLSHLFGITSKTHGDNNTIMQHTSPFTFFMHDILSGPTPSERIMNGIIVDTQTTTTRKIPFSKPNNRVFPIGIPIVDTSNNNIGSPTTTTVIKNIDKNKVVIIDKNNQLPLGVTLEKLLFGRITVIDNEITKGYEFGSEVIGKAQGFHLASSLDGSSKTMAFSALFDNEGRDEENEDAISFFGVHRTAMRDSCIAVVGGTGKFENARGYAKIETVVDLHDDQHPTNGVEKLFQITVYLS